MNNGFSDSREVVLSFYKMEHKQNEEKEHKRIQALFTPQNTCKCKCTRCGHRKVCRLFGGQWCCEICVSELKYGLKLANCIDIPVRNSTKSLEALEEVQ